MPFSVTAAARHEKRVKLKFNDEDLELFYNAGEKYREYQLKANALDEEFTDLQRRLQRAAANMRPAATPEEEALSENGRPDDSEDVYEDLKKAMEGVRRRIADNLCVIITKWDLEGDLDYIKQRMSKADQKRFSEVAGEGVVPIDGAWLDALPLPDEFILMIAQGITENFERGGQAGKGRSKASLKQAG